MTNQINATVNEFIPHTFCRWCSRKYPSAIIECVENKQVDPEWYYTPMHPSEDKPAPKDEDEMVIAIFDCIDRLMNIVRRRKLLYMAIDGVAPRAKMNQQSSRRFRATKKAVEKRLEIERIRSELLIKGLRTYQEDQHVVRRSNKDAEGKVDKESNNRKKLILTGALIQKKKQQQQQV
uniref:Xrn1 N-terminal domain-containing protein n=1 Tax=Glossina austeni TaxID=7395 RepID=A0A1A9V7H6_GLOAU